MQITNLTANEYDLPGLRLHANETVTFDVARYTGDDRFRLEVNTLVANGKISVATAPIGFPIQTALEAEIARGEVPGAATTGGSQPLLTASVTLTNAEILALTNGFELVPAQGAGRLLRFVYGVLVLDTTAAAYTNPFRSISWVYDTLNAFDGASTGIAAGFNDQFFTLGGVCQVSFASSADPSGVDLRNTNLGLTANNNAGGGGMTGGDPANTLTVTTYYAVL